MSDLPNKEVLLPPLPTEHEDVLTSPTSPQLSKQHPQLGALHTLMNANPVYVHHSAETSTTTASATSASLSPPHRLLTPSTDLTTFEMEQFYVKEQTNGNMNEPGKSHIISSSISEASGIISTDDTISNFNEELPLASAPDFQLESPRLTFPPALKLALNMNGSTSPFAASITDTDEILSPTASTPTINTTSRQHDIVRPALGSSTTTTNSTPASTSLTHSHANSVSSNTTSTMCEINNVGGNNNTKHSSNTTSGSSNAAGGGSINQSPLKRLKSFTSRGIRKLSLLNQNQNQNLNQNLALSQNMSVNNGLPATPSFTFGIPPAVPLQHPSNSPSAISANTSTSNGLPAPQGANGGEGYFGNSSSNTPTSNSSFSNLSNYFNRKRSNTTSSSASSHSLSVKFTLSQTFATTTNTSTYVTPSSATTTMAPPPPVHTTNVSNNNISGSGSTLILVPTVESVESKFMTSNPGFTYESKLDCLNYLNHLTIERKAMVDSVACLKQQLSKSGWLTPKDLNGMNLSDLSGIDDKINQLEELITKKRSTPST
ncbi:uncharacterized protein KQ657_000721 [Scheffersomyces spartinae]|uniref:Uncharacterized protein n=1 Tax=Scheffersomyces spartinae TaxID=45513 RepID=A0A9P7V8T8_9ASCO|nr:uncharacterized protein KQ657_000721 [Scheffersomyces spartinae]KAG7193309.1 hypothetical protein KQ657_000721 [Scheffersomyces spartinae]